MSGMIHILYSKYSGKKILPTILCVLFFIFNSQQSIVHCQIATYPVQVSVNLIPPYSLYLSDYAAGAREHISITLINRDVNRPGLNVRLRLTIKGQGFTVQTLPQTVFMPIVIDPNIPYRLSQQELAPYFDAAALNAQGLGTQSYRNEGKLPEGMLQFCVDVIEYNTGRVISQQGCGMAWLAVQKPPTLSLPFNSEKVTVRDPLNLLFQWTPRHSGLAGVEYEIIVKQLFDNGMAPEAAFAYSPEIIRERTGNTTFLYGATTPPLTPGYRYAWAVKAIASDGFAEQRVFENDGMSEIRVFSLEDYCPPPVGITAAYDKGIVTVQWAPETAHSEYVVAYRKKESLDEWLYARCLVPPARLTEVTLGKTYEYRVGAACGTNSIIYGQMLSFAVPATDTAYLANCGIAPTIDLSNKTPLESLAAGEQFMAYDFPVTVLTVSGSNGIFTGTGWTQMPGMFNFAKYKLKFNNITLNSDRRMIAGQCESIADPDEGQLANLDDIFEGGALYGKVQNGITMTDFEVDFTIDENTEFTYDPATGMMTVTASDGRQQQMAVGAATATAAQEDRTGGENVPSPFENGGSVTVKDKDGNLYKVEQTDPDDPTALTATQTGKASTELTADNFNPKHLDYDRAIVTFRKGNGFYAFDTWQDYYEKAYLIRDRYENLSQIYRVPWKLLPQGKSDIIEATVDVKDKDTDPAKVVFKTPKGVEFKSVYNNGVYTIDITGGESGDGQEIYAVYQSGNKFLNLGKLSVATYKEQTYKVAIVPVSDTPIDMAAIRQTLKDIYEPVGIHWQVTEEKGYFYSGESMFFEKSSGLLHEYTPEMRAMNADFAGKYDIDEKTNYLFILKYSGSDKPERDAAGFMPRGCQFGYIFTREFGSDREILQTIAHELGHGKLLLKHTFDKDYGMVQGTTDNLMDYTPAATHIAKWQWDLCSDPGIALAVFERDEDAMLGGVASIVDEKMQIMSEIHIYKQKNDDDLNIEEAAQKISESLNKQFNPLKPFSKKVTVDYKEKTRSIQFVFNVISHKETPEEMVKIANRNTDIFVNYFLVFNDPDGGVLGHACGGNSGILQLNMDESVWAHEMLHMLGWKLTSCGDHYEDEENKDKIMFRKRTIENTNAPVTQDDIDKILVGNMSFSIDKRSSITHKFEPTKFIFCTKGFRNYIYDKPGFNDNKPLNHNDDNPQKTDKWKTYNIYIDEPQ
jgi:hypothetical protein